MKNYLKLKEKTTKNKDNKEDINILLQRFMANEVIRVGTKKDENKSIL